MKRNEHGDFVIEHDGDKLEVIGDLDEHDKPIAWLRVETPYGEGEIEIGGYSMKVTDVQGRAGISLPADAVSDLIAALAYCVRPKSLEHAEFPGEQDPRCTCDSPLLGLHTVGCNIWSS